MDGGSLSAASSPKAMDDAEVLSRRTSPCQGEMQEAIRVAPEGDTQAAGHTGEQTPLETGDGGHTQFSPQPNTILEAIRLRNQASSLLQKKEVYRFHR